MTRSRRLRVESLEDRRMLATFTVTNLLDGAVTAAGQLPGSLRQAIFDANAASGADEIEFSGVSGQIALLYGELRITNELAINGPGRDLLTINPYDRSRIFNIDVPNTSSESFPVSINNLSLINGQLQFSGKGGAIQSLSSGTLTLFNTNINGNYARDGGGGVYAKGSVVAIDCTITNNANNNSSARGGGIATTKSLTVIDCIVENNSSRTGGGLSATEDLTVINSRVIANFATHSGGGLSSGLSTTVVNSIVSGNQAATNSVSIGGGGGGIISGGTVTIEDSAVSYNRTDASQAPGGGIHAASGVTLVRSAVNGNATTGVSSRGGGIVNLSGSVRLFESTMSGNSTAGQSSVGGGIANNLAGSISIVRSTIDSNQTTGANAFGGGVHGGPLAVFNSTISGNRTTGNSSHGAGVSVEGATTIHHSTLVNNQASGASSRGGAINHPSGALTISNTIIADNSALLSNPELFHAGGALDVNYSLIENPTDSGITPSTGSGNLLNVAAGLTPLQFNGGVTKTHALAATSPAINSGDPSAQAGVFNVPQLDQREFFRVADGRIDMGAFEYASLVEQPSLVVTTENDVVDQFDNLTSLREAIQYANSLVGVDVITFDASVYGNATTITLLLGEYQITETLTIVGTGRELLTLDAQHESRIFNITAASGNFEIEGLTFVNGMTTGATQTGGAVNSTTLGTLMIVGCTFEGSTTSGRDARGGALSATGNVVVERCNFIDNRTIGRNARGGAISTGFLTAGSLTLSDSLVANNSTTGWLADGGGISAGFIATITRSRVTGNSTSGYSAEGGGIFAADLTVVESTVSANSTEASVGGASGGGIYCDDLELVSSTLSGNSSAGSGGGAFARNVAITQSTISGNRCSDYYSDGGGIFAYEDVTISNSTVTGNRSVDGRGGGIYQYNFYSPGGAPFVIRNTIVAGNRAVHAEAGHDISHDADGSLSVDNSLIGNTTNLIAMTGGGNLLNVDPLLEPLQDNGGPTFTHALLPDSPAIDAGDPEFTSPPNFDQRGAGFDRVANGRIDMGAFEVQAEVSLPGDYNDDGVVTGRDFLAWQRGESPDPFSSDDLETWQEEYGGGELSALSASIEDQYGTYEDDEETSVSLMFGNSYAPPAEAGSPEANELFVESLDLAIEELSTISTYGVREFGDFVARRSIKSKIFAR